jgi:AraC-like DNA-binding protein
VNAPEPAGDDRGILHPRAGQQAFTVARHAVSAPLAPFVAYLWTVEWDVPAGRSHEQRILPNPAVHLSFQPDRARLTGPLRHRAFREVLRGRSRVVGVRFRAGGARPWLGGSVSQLADKQLPVSVLVDVDADLLRATVRDAPDVGTAAARVDAALAPLAPAPDPMVERAEGLVQRVGSEPGIRRVEQLAEEEGTTVRSLQRFCAEWIGLSPRDLIRWARLHEAAARAAEGPVDWAALAAELGYADQAHLVRDFGRVVGEPPGRYARAEIR